MKKRLKSTGKSGTGVEDINFYAIEEMIMESLQHLHDQATAGA